MTAMALLTIASASAFGMYGRGDGWIDFLVHGNQLRARMDQLGFVLGNATIKGTFGFKAEGNYWGQILSGQTDNIYLLPSISGGIGYTSEMIGIGVGYSYTMAKDYLGGYIGVHTPVLMVNALNNNLRISIPIQVAVKEYSLGNVKETYTGVAFDNIQLRYYTGIDAFNAIRVYFYYRNSTFRYNNDASKYSTSEIFGFQTRFYFLNTTVGNVGINPFVRVDFHTVLKGGVNNGEYIYKAEDVGNGRFVSGTVKQSDYYAKNPYKVSAQVALGITANSDIVSLYVEPSLGYTGNYAGQANTISTDGTITKGPDPKVEHKLAWGAYTELYIRPVQDLEWYFEMDVNNSGTKQNSGIPVYFETTTGITWYLPALNGAQ
ncbi:serpulina hyodysenteriae variable surface protein [Brachyspira intermedia PWS/A]|uniref:Serpulina hyodysenteriae variable surface protein n=1 Tax=Brachyspira intermedia (strain ATCC 51140 / PWS/A) TaxID=1045858 RepID=G0EQH1_BRAIP|nr:serpulina hyodysenteriae variable surface protein [Brachyspira intermedia PWS/A]